MPPPRRPLLDVVRGSAVLFMILYHFCYDLDWIGWVAWDLNHHPAWQIARAAIITLFLGTVGISLVLGHQPNIRWRAFGRRFVLLSLTALGISLVSYIIFQHRFIFFGILHFIAIASVLSLPLLRWPPWLNIGAALFVLTLGLTVEHPFFNQSGWQWLGLMTQRPATEDYVPLLPWLGVVWLGIAGGQWLVQFPNTWPTPQGRGWRMLIGLGRHSLFIYLIHQPILLASLWLLMYLGTEIKLL